MIRYSRVVKMKNIVGSAAYNYSRARGLVFGAEFLLLSTLAKLVPGSKNPIEKSDKRLSRAVQKEFFAILKKDSENIQNNIYPMQVLMPELPSLHIRRLSKIIIDGFSIHKRRVSGNIRDFSSQAQDLLEDLPHYYQRNFHFQTDGYLSEKSAHLYDHQVELLFAGAGDAMRRLGLPPMKSFLNGDGKGKMFLEIGAGTGRMTRFVRQTFPKVKIVATDLSIPYLKVAQKNLANFNRIDFVQGDGANLPFQDQHFDCVYSVFLFHELPLEVRRDILKESLRLLKPGGLLVCIDSVQLGDSEAFDPILKDFPRDYHEPFYHNYISTPLETLLKQSGFTQIKSEVGFSSKVCWALKSQKSEIA